MGNQELQLVQLKEEFSNLLSLVIEDHLDHTTDYYDVGDGQAPFFSEAYLYNLIGKEDARTILNRVNAIGRTLGFSYETLP